MTEFTYDAVGRLTAVTDPLGATTRLERLRDRYGRLKAERVNDRTHHHGTTRLPDLGRPPPPAEPLTSARG